MEGDGPVSGTPVNSRVCVVSPDWLAADRVAVELMGIDFAKVGYSTIAPKPISAKATWPKSRFSARR